MFLIAPLNPADQSRIFRVDSYSASTWSLEKYLHHPVLQLKFISLWRVAANLRDIQLTWILLLVSVENQHGCG